MDVNINRIRERRQIEATRKNLLGRNGKLTVVARILGQPVKSEGFFASSNTLPDPDNFLDDRPSGESFDPTEVHEAGWDYWDQQVRTIGHVFDGLSSGLHLEIRHIADRLIVEYRGDRVFHEEAGELLAYVPGEWEESVDRLYARAMKRVKETKKDPKPEKERTLAKIFEELKKRWGF